MTQMVAAAASGRTVVVGMKLDSKSRELMTWTLVNVARAGDRVIALHVLDNNEIVDRDGKSSLFSLVKAFDSLLEVYEGFCNLKQIDLKLKVCRGSSIKKVLVHEVKSFNATEVVLGTAQTHHTIRSSVSVAKYCGRKLSKNCSVVAVNDGKIVFHRESKSGSRISSIGTDHQCQNGSANALLQGSLGMNMKVVNDGQLVTPVSTGESGLVLAGSGSVADAIEWHCSVCSPESIAQGNSCAGSSQKRSGDDNKENSTAMVLVQKPEAASSSTSRQSSEVNLGWPLLCQAVFPSGPASCKSGLNPDSMVQQEVELANLGDFTQDDSDADSNRDQSTEQDGESKAIVLNGIENVSVPSSPHCISKILLDELTSLHEKYSATCRLFTFQELVSATSNFTTGNIIGKGGSSQVYRGHLPDGKLIAVKILKPSENAMQEFVLEIKILNALHHKNIISLFGFCFENNHLLLVYDFVSRGSLEENLRGDRKESLSFGWNERYRVAVGVADALAYLHGREGQPVIHRDVKSSNILLADDFEPQLSDFGLAKWASATSTYITCSNVAGTFGYLAPEYFMYGKVNAKIDVYAYGVVLLELLSGRKPISNDSPKGAESLVMWAKPILHSDKVVQLLDPNLGSSYDREQLERMVLAASLCIRHTPRARPHMSLVLKILQGDTEALKWARMQVYASEVSLDALDDETFPQPPNLQSHLNLALLGVEEDSLSISSIEQSVSLEDYLRGRWSRSSSLD